ncbi:hypothetical protein OS31_26980 [Dickeya oryzae]
MAIAMLVLMPFAYTEPLLNIRLLGVSINASLLEGIWQMTRQGHPVTASIVAFCTIGAPLTLVFALLYLFFRSTRRHEPASGLVAVRTPERMGHAGRVSGWSGGRVD